MEKYKLSEYNIKHIRTEWTQCIKLFLTSNDTCLKDYMVIYFVTDPLYLDSDYKVPFPRHITVAFIYVKKYPGRIFICYSDHRKGVYERMGRKRDYICNNYNLLVGSAIENDHIQCDASEISDPDYIYVDWISGNIHQTFKISVFPRHLSDWIIELRNNILDHIMFHWKKLFIEISKKNIKTYHVICNDVDNVSSMITAKTIEFMFIYSRDTIFYFLSHINDIDRIEYKCDRHNALYEKYQRDPMYIERGIPKQITLKWCKKT